LDTYLIATGEITDLEVQTSERMQDYFLDFVEDPESLPGMDGLNMMSLRPRGKLAQFGADGQVVQFVDGDTVEALVIFLMMCIIPLPEAA
jgi:hypothetical protein